MESIASYVCAERWNGSWSPTDDGDELSVVPFTGSGQNPLRSAEQNSRSAAWKRCYWQGPDGLQVCASLCYGAFHLPQKLEFSAGSDVTFTKFPFENKNKSSLVGFSLLWHCSLVLASYSTPRTGTRDYQANNRLIIGLKGALWKRHAIEKETCLLYTLTRFIPGCIIWKKRWRCWCRSWSATTAL